MDDVQRVMILTTADSFIISTVFIQLLIFHFLDNSVLQYDMQNLEVPTIQILGSLVKSGIRVLVFR